jgi:hypothetical protein
MARLIAVVSAPLLLAAIGACSASGDPASDLGSGAANGSGATGGTIEPGTGGAGGTGGVVATGGTIATGGTGTGGSDPGGSGGTGETCAQAEAQATLVTEPIDIIVALDNSGSMDDELEAVEQNINVNFAQILDDGEVDYRVILISRHRKAGRDETAEASTSICVEAPLSGLAMCPSPTPVFSERFYHFFTKIESDDSFDVILGTYYPPIPSDYEDRADQAPL